MNQAAYEKAVRDAKRARCAVCGRRVCVEDLCQDGLYLHNECARRTSTQPRLRSSVTTER